MTQDDTHQLDGKQWVKYWSVDTVHHYFFLNVGIKNCKADKKFHEKE